MPSKAQYQRAKAKRDREIIERPDEFPAKLSRQNMSPATVRQVLKETRGDIQMAADMHGTTYRDMDLYIRRVPELQRFYETIRIAKVSKDCERMLDDQFAVHVERLEKFYELEGLEVIHEIATGSATSAAALEVKLRAAMQLRSRKGGDTAPAGSLASQPATLHGVLAELAQDYHAAAPRIREIRETRILLDQPGNSAPHQPSSSSVEVLSPPGGDPGR